MPSDTYSISNARRTGRCRGIGCIHLPL